MKTQVQFKEKCELLSGNISEERIYVTFWNNYPQSTTGLKEGTKWSQEHMGASGSPSWSSWLHRDFLPFSITVNSSNRSLTFSYLSVLVSCLRSLACASNAAHWRNNRNDMPVSIYCLSHPQTDSLRLASNGVTVALLWSSSSFIIPEMVKFALPYIHFDDIKPSDTYQKLVFSMCVSKHYSWALATSLFRPYENATLGNV